MKRRAGYTALMRVALGLVPLLLMGACHRSPPPDTRAPADQIMRATATIAGTSISDVVGSDVEQILRTVAWTPAGASLNVTGPMEVLNVPADRGPLHATVSIVRPRRTPGQTTRRGASAREQEAFFGAYAATLLDEPVLVAVAIKDHKDEATKLLDAIVQR